MRRALFLLVTAAGCQLIFPLHPLGPYAVEVMSDAPVIYFRFGEAGGPTAVDETGHDNATYPPSGIAYGATGAILGDPNTAVSFDGTHGITVPPSVDFAGTDPFTLEFWAAPSVFAPLQFVLDHGDYNAQRNGWDIYVTSGGVTFERWNGGTTTGSVVSSPAGLALGSYHHVVATFDSVQLRLYVDAELQSFNAIATHISMTGTSWKIGRLNCPCSGLGYEGALDEVAIYATALTQDRISAHYHAAIGH